MTSYPQTFQSVFLIEVDKIRPNPMQPRREFNEESLQDLSESIKQYGVLQPLVVTRKETEVPTGTVVEYELIAGERRLRASKLAGLMQVPVIIREETDDKLKLELAIIENLQREDLNPLDRALAFKQLIDAFNLKHHEVGDRIGKSRAFVSNSLRLLNLPEEIQDGLKSGLITEGHTRPLLMVSDKGEEEQVRFYRDILARKITVREAERLSRQIASEKSRKRLTMDPQTKALEEKLSETFGTRVYIEKFGERGKIHIDFFSEEEFTSFLNKVMDEKIEEQKVVEEEIEKEMEEIEKTENVTKLPTQNGSDISDLISSFSI